MKQNEQWVTDAAWFKALKPALEDESFIQLQAFIQRERDQGKIIYPEKRDVFNAFNLTPLESVKVVILGQDPYHGAGQAHGLSFSVKDGVPIPPSLKNVYQEIADDIYGHDSRLPTSGCLSHWAQQGVLLLNTVLTVEEATPNSHQKQGWEVFTDAVIRCINEQRKGVIFILWGGYAKKKTKLVDTDKHHILSSAHPSPLSAYRGFVGCQHFSLVNSILKGQSQDPINWFDI